MSESSADREQRLARLEEDTEQRMHSVADALPDPEAVHERANRISERAREHAEHAAQLRAESNG